MPGGCHCSWETPKPPWSLGLPSDGCLLCLTQLSTPTEDSMDNSQDRIEPTQTPEFQLAYARLKQMAHFQAGFLGTASHELRAPVNKIISLHQLILEDLCESPEEEREFLHQANQAMYQVLKNLDLLIQVSKLDIGALDPALQPVSLGSVLAKVQQLMQMKCINRQCRLTVEPPSHHLSVVTDSHWLQQLLLLLIDGALVAGSGRVTLSVQGTAEAAVTLQMVSDTALSHWQASPQASLDPKPEPTELSPSFRVQMARLMTPRLNGTILCQATQEDGTEILITLPTAP
jgi:signal transduction histidine kinase